MDLTFKNQVAHLLDALKAQGQRPDLELYLFLGPPDPAAVRSLRQQIPPSAFLFYVFPPAPEIQEHTRLQAQPENELTLFAPAEPQGEVLERLAFVMRTLKTREVRHCFPDPVPPLLRPVVTELIRVSNDTLLNLDHERVSRLVKFRCAIRNMPAMRLRACALPTASGRPAIVCGAGPSLTAALPILKPVAGQAAILAVGRALPLLIEAGIQPDVVVEVDALSHYNWRHTLKPTGLLVAPATVAPEVADRFDRIIWGLSDMPAVNAALVALGIPLQPLTLSGSVLVTAVDLAIRVGCRQLALIGADFCLASDGRSHATGYQVETFAREEWIQVTGNQGHPVFTTPEFQINRLALEAYCASLAPGARRPCLYNCSSTGAVIKSIAPLDLSEFIKNHVVTNSNTLNLTAIPISSGSSPTLPDRLTSLRASLRSYQDLCGQQHDCATRLLNALTSATPDTTRLQALQQELDAWHNKAQPFYAQTNLTPWLDTLSALLEDFAAEKAQPACGQSAGPTLLTAYQWRAQLTQALIADLLSDMDHAIRPFHTQEPTALPPVPSPPADPRTYMAFKSHAINFIRQANPAMAQLLSDPPQPKAPTDFDIFYFGTDLPYVRFRKEGVEGGLTGSLNVMKRAVTTEVVAFLQARQFQPVADALVIVGPENWWDVIECSRLCPGLDLAIVEPWLDLFADLIEHGLFLHRLPETSLVVGIHDQLPSWPDTLKTRLTTWKQQGKRIFVYSPARVQAIPGIQALIKQVEGMTR